MADILKAGPKDVQSYFKSEQIAYKSLNPYIFVDLVEMILEDVPEVMFDAPKGEFKQLLTVILLNAMIYRGDQKLLKKIYGLFLKITTHISLYNSFISKQAVEDILTLKVLSEMIKKTNFDYGTQTINNIKVTDEQKLILEIIF